MQGQGQGSPRGWRLPLLLCTLFAAACSRPGAAQQQLHSEISSHHPRIYVAPLPDIFNYRVLTDYDVKRFFHQFGTDPQSLISNPVGAIEDKIDDLELRNTYMYGLDVLFHTQMLQSPLRVHSQEEADLIYLPFYAAMECRLSQAMKGDDHKKAYHAKVQKFWENFQTDFPYYKEKPHFVAIGRREAELMGGCGVGNEMYCSRLCVESCTLLCHEHAEHIHVLTVEVWTGDLEKMGPNRQRPNSIAVPWPGHLHTVAGSAYFQKEFNRKAFAEMKKTIAMESMKVRFPLRETLFKQCNEREPQCIHFNLRGNIGQFNQSLIYEVTRAAWYCLQPYGDGPSRHVTMDCIGASTIPVFFDKYLRQHMPFSDIVDYGEISVVVEPSELDSSNIIDLLKERYPEAARLDMAQRLHQLKHIFLYSVNPQHTLIRFDEMHAIHPADDAFTSSIKALLRHACARGTLPSGKCRSSDSTARRLS